MERQTRFFSISGKNIKNDKKCHKLVKNWSKMSKIGQKCRKLVKNKKSVRSTPVSLIVCLIVCSSRCQLFAYFRKIIIIPCKPSILVALLMQQHILTIEFHLKEKLGTAEFFYLKKKRVNGAPDFYLLLTLAYQSPLFCF